MKNFLQHSHKGKKRTIFYLTKRMMMLLVAFLSVCVAYASTYSYLEFTSTSGTKTSFNVSGLVLTVEGNQLQVTNHEGSVNLVLTDLSSMQFTMNGCTTSVENTINADAPVQVSTMTGSLVGSYPSLVEAAKHLHTGVYVISNGTISQTILIQ